MSLAPGTRLGVYEVVAQIGEGGMGQVFRATDTKLKRQVAIKILPPSVAADHDRLARFQREAEVLASLNHPHIAGIYGLEENAGVTALVMELIEGEDLSQRIARGRIPIDEAVAIAKQIADALDAAHGQGIIHRDLKPANIKVRDDGTVKVLDFGLAKAMDPVAGSLPGISMSPTVSMHATQPGMILGTAAYMAPEQARGKAVDKRADIWAFGVVLFEMLTGRQAFHGEDTSHVLARVIERDPDWTALPQTTPPLVARLLRRCLEKDVRRRLRDIADAEPDLEDTTRLEMVGAAPTRARPLWPTAVAWTLAAVAAIISAWSFTRGTPQRASDPLRYTVAIPQGEELPMDPGLPPPVAISRDGHYIAYVTRRPSGNRIYLRRREDVDGRPIAGTEGGNGPFFLAGWTMARFRLRRLHQKSSDRGRHGAEHRGRFERSEGDVVGRGVDCVPPVVGRTVQSEGGWRHTYRTDTPERSGGAPGTVIHTWGPVRIVRRLAGGRSALHRASSICQRERESDCSKETIRSTSSAVGSLSLGPADSTPRRSI